jgi:hypothetical protein
MRLLFAFVSVTVALATGFPPATWGADAAPCSARIFYREDHATNSIKLQVVLDEVAAYYASSRNAAHGQNLGSQCPPSLTFRIMTNQATQAIYWVAIPLATLTSVELQWLPLPRSTFGFQQVRLPIKGGGAHTVEMLVDAKEYRYTRTDKHGVREQVLKGELAMRMEQPVAAANSGDGSELFYEWFGFRGMGERKQRPHSPDNEWIIQRELIDRIEFIPVEGEAPADK